MHFKGFKSIADTCSIFLAILHILRVVLADHDGSDDPLDWLRESIPGEPGVDYPIFSEIETTSFSCKDRVFGGYYADPEMQCQGYHVCLSSQFMPGIADRKMSFLCPNGTIFSQALFTCDWWFNVDCTEAESLWAGNEIIGDENARIGGDSVPSNQGPGQQPVQGGRRNNRPQQPQNNRNNNGQSQRPASQNTRNQGNQRQKTSSKRNQSPSRKSQQKTPTPRKQPKTKSRPRQQSSRPSKTNSRPKQQSNRPSKRKQTPKAKSNGRRNQSTSRKINNNKDSKKSPQKKTQVVTKSPQPSVRVVPSLPDYDGDSNGIPNYKPTKGIGSSSVLGVNGADRDLDQTLRITTDKPDILEYSESVTKTNIKNVEGFFVPTTSDKELFIQTGNGEDAAIPQSIVSKDDDLELTNDKKTANSIENKNDKTQNSFIQSTQQKNTTRKISNKTSIKKDNNSVMSIPLNSIDEKEVLKNDVSVTKNVNAEDNNYKDPKTIKVDVTLKPQLQRQNDNTDLKDDSIIEGSTIPAITESILDDQDLFLGLLGGILPENEQEILLTEDMKNDKKTTLDILFSKEKNGIKENKSKKSPNSENDNSLLIGLLGGSNRVKEDAGVNVPIETPLKSNSNDSIEENDLGILVLLQDPKILNTSNDTTSDGFLLTDELPTLNILDTFFSDVPTSTNNMVGENRVKEKQYDKEGKDIKIAIPSNKEGIVENENIDSISDRTSLEILFLSDKSDIQETFVDETKTKSKDVGQFPSLETTIINELEEDKNKNLAGQNDLGILVLLQDFSKDEENMIETNKFVANEKTNRNDVFDAIIRGIQPDSVVSSERTKNDGINYKEGKDIKDAIESTKKLKVEDVYLGLLVGDISIELEEGDEKQYPVDELTLNKTIINNGIDLRGDKDESILGSNANDTLNEIDTSKNLLDILFTTDLKNSQVISDEKIGKEYKNFKTPKGISITKDNSDTEFRLLLLGEAPDMRIKIDPTRINEIKISSEKNVATDSRGIGNFSSDNETIDRVQTEENNVNDLSILGIILEKVPIYKKQNDSNLTETKEINESAEGSGFYEQNDFEVYSLEEDIIVTENNIVTEQTINSDEKDNVLNDNFSILSIVLGDNTQNNDITTKNKIKQGKELTGEKVKVMIIETSLNGEDNVNASKKLQSKNDSRKTLKDLTTQNSRPQLPTNINITNNLDSSLLLLLVENIDATTDPASFSSINEQTNSCIGPCIDRSYKLSNSSKDDSNLNRKEENDYNIINDKLDENVQTINFGTSYPYYPIDYFPP